MLADIQNKAVKRPPCSNAGGGHNLQISYYYYIAIQKLIKSMQSRLFELLLVHIVIILLYKKGGLLSAFGWLI